MHIPSPRLGGLAPSAPDEPPETAEAVILLLRLLHGAQALPPEDLAEGE